MTQKKHLKTKEIEALVISDIHLGTYGCKANEFVKYLKTVDPKHIVLNGDIIDIWQFSTAYFPKAHTKVIRQLLKMMENGSHIYYLVGNHDENLRRFVDLKIGNLTIANKLVLELNGTKTWIFHGDVFDVVMHHSKWLAKVGAHAYGFLTITNRAVNAVLSLFGKHRISLSRDIKRAVKDQKRNKMTTRFESTVADLAIKKQYEYAICGHTHWPSKKKITNTDGEVTYLNGGDWVENMTALEYRDNDWHLVHYKQLLTEHIEDEPAEIDDLILSNEKVLFQTMFNDIVRS